MWLLESIAIEYILAQLIPQEINGGSTRLVYQPERTSLNVLVREDPTAKAVVPLSRKQQSRRC